MKKRWIVLLIAGFGLLPLWASVVWMIAEASRHGHGSDYWAAAPWAAIAGLYLSKYTVLAALVTIFVYHWVRGDAERKRRLATLTLAFGSVVSVGLAGWPYYRASEIRKHNERQRELVLEFALGSQDIRDAMPERGDLSVSIATGDNDGRARTFDVSIRPPSGLQGDPWANSIHAIIDVSDRDTQPNFSIRCFTRLDVGQRKSWDPCRQPLTKAEPSP